MPSFDGFSTGTLDVARFEVILLRMMVAGMLGAFLGYRLWRRLLPNMLPPARETAQAQTLIAIAGALMVVVIGQSTARAFGLVGLGGFIRFRSGIKDTRDAAVMFVMIGIGMACGLGAIPLACVATLFASIVLAIFDLGRRARLKLTKVAIHAAEPGLAWERIHLAFPGARVVELPGTASAQPGRLVMEAALADDMDAGAIMRLLADKQIPGINSVSIEDNGKGGTT
ncbi:MAG TPA: DUF4956 domain-containing protein [Polyangia bacterium]|nr:DUF4956 domain-containing protein [Polyangia bacterium]